MRYQLQCKTDTQQPTFSLSHKPHMQSQKRCASDRAGIQPRPQTKPIDTDAAKRSHSQRFDFLHPHNPRKYQGQ